MSGVWRAEMGWMKGGGRQRKRNRETKGEERPLTCAADKPARELAAGGEELVVVVVVVGGRDTANPISGHDFVLQLTANKGVEDGWRDGSGAEGEAERSLQEFSGPLCSLRLRLPPRLRACYRCRRRGNAVTGSNSGRLVSRRSTKG